MQLRNHAADRVGAAQGYVSDEQRCIGTRHTCLLFPSPILRPPSCNWSVRHSWLHIGYYTCRGRTDRGSLHCAQVRLPLHGLPWPWPPMWGMVTGRRTMVQQTPLCVSESKAPVILMAPARLGRSGALMRTPTGPPPAGMWDLKAPVGRVEEAARPGGPGGCVRAW